MSFHNNIENNLPSNYKSLAPQIKKSLRSVDRSSSIPLYLQLLDSLKKVIDDKEIEPGGFFATESLLQKETQLSRSTVRKALEELVRLKHLIRITGKGTFVSISIPKESVVLSELKSMSQGLIDRGMSPGSIILNTKKMKPPKEVSEKLQLDSSEEVLYIERIRTGNSIPILYVEGYIPLKIGISNIDEIPESLYQFVQENGVSIQNAKHVINASKISATVSKYLGVEESSVGMTMERTTFDDTQSPVIYEEGIFRADLYSYTLVMQK